MITTAGLWIPGGLVSTNDALSLARAAGFYQGRGGGGVVRGVDGYAAAVGAMRIRAGLRARAAKLAGAVPPDRRARLRFTVCGHPRWDAAAGYLAAKWAEDGLTDAGVMASDRHNVAEVAVAISRRPGAPAGVYVSIELLPGVP